RCVLDHLVYSAAATHAGNPTPPQGGRLAMPIVTTEELWQKNLHRLEGVPEDVIEYFRSKQPFATHTNSRESPLWLLHRLNNVDKHRYLPISAYAVAEVEMMMEKIPEIEGAMDVNIEPLNSRDWIFQLVTPVPGHFTDMTINYTIVIAFVEEGAPRRSFEDELERMVEAVADVARPFSILDHPLPSYFGRQ